MSTPRPSVASRTARSKSPDESNPPAAPCSSAHASLSCLVDVTKTSAPSARASWNVAVEVPPPTPITSTRSPVRSRARRSIRSAEDVTSPNAAASTQPSRSGLGTTFTAGTTTASAWVPQRCSPTIANRRRTGRRLARTPRRRRTRSTGRSPPRRRARRRSTSAPTASIDARRRRRRPRGGATAARQCRARPTDRGGSAPTPAARRARRAARVRASGHRRARRPRDR